MLSCLLEVVVIVNVIWIVRPVSCFSLVVRRWSAANIGSRLDTRSESLFFKKIRSCHVVGATIEWTDGIESQPSEILNEDDRELDVSKSSLFDVSLESDPDWKEMRVPFVEPFANKGDGNDGAEYLNYIDVKLAFVAELDGVTYGVAVPFDAVVAIVVENLETGAVQYLSPDNDDNKELMEIMAVQLHESFGADLQLKRTPRVLTVSGPLEERYLKNWKDVVLPDPVEARELMTDDDQDAGYFHQFMKDELGEEYWKIMNDDTDDELDSEILQLLEITSDDERAMDNTSLDAILQTVVDDPEDEGAFQVEMENILNRRQESFTPSMYHDGTALKLISYILPPTQSENKKMKSYSLVKLMKPYAIVGKYIPSKDASSVRFDLLTHEEENMVVPKLEEVFWLDLEESGLALRTTRQ